MKILSVLAICFISIFIFSFQFVRYSFNIEVGSGGMVHAITDGTDEGLMVVRLPFSTLTYDQINFFEDLLNEYANTYATNIIVESGEELGPNRHLRKYFILIPKNGPGFLDGVNFLLDQDRIIDFSSSTQLYYSSDVYDKQAFNHFDRLNQSFHNTNFDIVNVYQMSCFFRTSEYLNWNSYGFFLQSHDVHYTEAWFSSRIAEFPEARIGFGNSGRRIDIREDRDLINLSVVTFILFTVMVGNIFAKKANEICIRKINGTKAITIYNKLFLKDDILYLVTFIISMIIMSVIFIGSYRPITIGIYHTLGIYSFSILICLVLLAAIRILFIRRISLKWLKNGQGLIRYLYAIILVKIAIGLLIIVPLITTWNTFQEAFEDRIYSIQFYRNMENYYSIWNLNMDFEQFIFGTNKQVLFQLFERHGGLFIDTMKYDFLIAFEDEQKMQYPLAIMSFNSLSEHTLYDLEGNEIILEELDSNYHYIFIPYGYNIEPHDYPRYQVEHGFPFQVIFVMDTPNIRNLIPNTGIRHVLQRPVIAYFSSYNPVTFPRQINFGYPNNRISFETNQDRERFFEELDSLDFRDDIAFFNVYQSGALARLNIDSQMVYVIILLLSYLATVLLLSIAGLHFFFLIKQKDIVVKHLHGFHFIEIYKEILLINIFTNFIVAAYAYMHTFNLVHYFIVYFFTISIIEIVLVKFYIDKTIDKKTIKFLKT